MSLAKFTAGKWEAGVDHEKVIVALETLISDIRAGSAVVSEVKIATNYTSDGWTTESLLVTYAKPKTEDQQ